MYFEISTVYHFAFLGWKCGCVALFGKLTVISEKILHTSMYELCCRCVSLCLLPLVSVVNKLYPAGCSSNGVKLYFRNTQVYLVQVGCSGSASV